MNGGEDQVAPEKEADKNGCMVPKLHDNYSIHYFRKKIKNTVCEEGGY